MYNFNQAYQWMGKILITITLGLMVAPAMAGGVGKFVKPGNVNKFHAEGEFRHLQKHFGGSGAIKFKKGPDAPENAGEIAYLAGGIACEELPQVVRYIESNFKPTPGCQTLIYGMPGRYVLLPKYTSNTHTFELARYYFLAGPLEGQVRFGYWGRPVPHNSTKS